MLDFAFALWHGFKYTTIKDLNHLITAISIKLEEPREVKIKQERPKEVRPTKYKDLIIGIPSWIGLFVFVYYLSGQQMHIAFVGATGITFGILSYFKRK